MTESLCCPSETVIALSTNYIPTLNKKFFLKKKMFSFKSIRCRPSPPLPPLTLWASIPSSIKRAQEDCAESIATRWEETSVAQSLVQRRSSSVWFCFLSHLLASTIALNLPEMPLQGPQLTPAPTFIYRCHFGRVSFCSLGLHFLATALVPQQRELRWRSRPSASPLARHAC